LVGDELADRARDLAVELDRLLGALRPAGAPEFVLGDAHQRVPVEPLLEVPPEIVVVLVEVAHLDSPQSAISAARATRLISLAMRSGSFCPFVLRAPASIDTVPVVATFPITRWMTITTYASGSTSARSAPAFCPRVIASVTTAIHGVA